MDRWTESSLIVLSPPWSHGHIPWALLQTLSHWWELKSQTCNYRKKDRPYVWNVSTLCDWAPWKKKKKAKMPKQTSAAPSLQLHICRTPSKVTMWPKPQIHTTTSRTKGSNQTFIAESDKHSICLDLAQGVTTKGQTFDPDALLKQIQLIVRMESMKRTSLPSIERVFVEGERGAAALQHTDPGVQLMTCEGGWS